MKMMLFPFFLSLLFLISCVQPGGDKGKTAKEDKMYRASDTIIQDVPDYLNSDNSLHEYWKKKEEVVKLQSLRNGFAGLQFRIWIDCSGSKNDQVIVVTESKGKWVAKFYDYMLNYDTEGNIESGTYKMEKRDPKSGWDSVSTKLLSIKDLPDFRKEASKYSLPNDASMVSVEVASPLKYRFYEYPDLEFNKSNADGPAKLYEVLSFIENEFDFKGNCY